MRHTRFLALFGMLLGACTSGAAAIDLHAYWDSRCAQCHGHAAEFVRKHMKVVDGRLIGVSAKRDVTTFLKTHESSGEHADQLYKMLLAQAQTPPLFQQKCAGCHGTAADYARKTLVLEGGVAKVRDDKRTVREVLARHGKVTPAEANTIADSLARVLTESGASKGG